MQNIPTYRKRTRVIEEFIELYRSEPCLWRVKSKEYHDRSMREAAYAKLLAKLRESEPDAVKDTVVKKINNLRSNIRKEKKKIKASKKSGAGPDDLYKPSLWYYDMFSFLDDQDMTGTSPPNSHDEERSGSDDDNDKKEASESMLHFQNIFQMAYNNDDVSTSTSRSTRHRAHPYSRPSNNKKSTATNLSDELLILVRNYLKKPLEVEDRYDHFGKTVAMRVRGLEKSQRLVAEKMINDILFEAEMGSLDHGDGHVEHFMENKAAS